MMRILVVEDEKLLCDGIAEDLELEKYTVERCYDGAEAYDLLLSESFDLLILDLNLPGMDGLDLLRAVRAEQPELRVLILSARAELSDRVAGLDLGADDYLTKPFSLEELQARILAVLRRTAGRRNVESVRLTNGPLVMEPAKRICRFGEADVKLTDTEYRLLQRLMEKPGHLRNHGELLRTVWGPEALDDLPLLRVTLTRIRKKLQAAGAVGPVIASYSGVGYLLDDYSDL